MVGAAAPVQVVAWSAGGLGAMGNGAAAFIGVADFRIAPGQEARFARLMLDVVPHVRSNPANLQFEIYQSRDTPGRFLLYQVFIDEAAWQAHRASPVVSTAFHATAECFAAPPERRDWEPLPVVHPSPAPPARPVAHATRSLFHLREGAEARHFAARRAYVRGLLTRGSMLRFDVARSLTDPGEHMIFGRWDSQAAWAANEEEPEYLRFKADVKDDFAAPSRRDFWSAPLP